MPIPHFYLLKGDYRTIGFAVSPLYVVVTSAGCSRAGAVGGGSRRGTHRCFRDTKGPNVGHGFPMHAQKIGILRKRKLTPLHQQS